MFIYIWIPHIYMFIYVNLVQKQMVNTIQENKQKSLLKGRCMYILYINAHIYIFICDKELTIGFASMNIRVNHPPAYPVHHVFVIIQKAYHAYIHM